MKFSKYTHDDIDELLRRTSNGKKWQYSFSQPERYYRMLRSDVLTGDIRGGHVTIERNSLVTDSIGIPGRDAIIYFFRFVPKKGTPVRLTEVPGMRLERLYEKLEQRVHA